MKHTPKITVVGSINMDLVTITNQVPNMGETLMGNHFQMNPGGKGANQAIAAARLGAEVQMIGCVGKDTFGKDLHQHLRNEGVNADNVEPVTDETATATVVVTNKENSIIVVPAANNYVTPEYVESKRNVIASSDVLILQLEIPLKGVIKAVNIAKQNNVKVILNPAPIQMLSTNLLKQIDYLTPNEHEQKFLQNAGNDKDLQKRVIITKGKKGVSFFEDDQEITIPAYQVNVVDTTGAGDAFNGGFAVALSKGLTVKQACKYGNAVAALSTTKFGAQTGMPTEKEVSVFIGK